MLVYLAMTFSGADPMRPDVASITGWGGNLGVLTIQNEWWRLVSSMFVHVGLLHIAFNMWVLHHVGGVVERLFGNVGFALLYLLSGIGGSIASFYMHPFNVSAGASGAIFGTFGALLGVLAVQRRRFPIVLFMGLRRFAITFVGLNVLIGFSLPFIDNAAHIGGLATGFLCGLFLYRPLPQFLPEDEVQAGSGLFRRFIGVVLLSAALAVAAWQSSHSVRNTPKVDFAIFLDHLKPSAERFNNVFEQLFELQKAIQEQRPIEQHKVEELLEETRAIEEQSADLKAATAEVAELRDVFVSAVQSEIEAVKALQEGDSGLPAFFEQMAELHGALNKFEELRREIEEQ